MSIQLTCSCGKAYAVPEQHAGRKVRCRACQAVMVVPDPSHHGDPGGWGYDGITGQPQKGSVPAPVAPVDPGVFVPKQLTPVTVPGAPIPMNGVGLVSLFFGLGSQLLAVLSCLGVLSLMVHRFRSSTWVDAAAGPCFFLCLTAGSLGILISRLGQQPMVRKYSVIGMRLSISPILLTVVYVVYHRSLPDHEGSGRNALDASKFTDAEREYRIAYNETLWSDPDHRRMYIMSGLATALSGLDRYDESLAFHEKAVKEAEAESDNEYTVILLLQKQIATLLEAKLYNQAEVAILKHILLEDRISVLSYPPTDSYILLSRVYALDNNSQSAFFAVRTAMDRLESKSLEHSIPYASCLEQGVILGRRFGTSTEFIQKLMLDRAKNIRKNFPDVSMPEIQIAR